LLKPPHRLPPQPLKRPANSAERLYGYQVQRGEFTPTTRTKTYNRHCFRTIFVSTARINICLFLIAAAAPAEQNLADVSLEDLSNIQVTSASKKSESLAHAPAAIFVLTGEDIRRGGFTTLPEALRTVPGLYVARTDSRIWQISTRGFSDLNNNKMLVLVDGRSVYSPEIGSVFWDVLDVPLENIDRVEIIRGPGGTLWGANAVNGVINIVTKSADQAQGVMVSTSADIEEGYTSTVRYGGQVGSAISYYVFGKASYWEPLASPSGGDLQNRLGLPQAGARMDWKISDKDSLTLEAGTYDSRYRSNVLGTTIPATYLQKGSDVVLHWKHKISPRSDTEATAYCDWHTRYGSPGESRNSCAIEFQHSYKFTDRHSLIWGGSLFTTGDDLRLDPSPFNPEQRRDNVVSGFAQYEFVVIPDKLRVLAGSKLEHNDYTGVEYQPQIRAVWTPAQQHTLWASLSRAVRTPTRNDSDLNLLVQVGQLNGLPFFVDIHGTPNLESEKLKAYELGYRYQPRSTLSFDAAFFYNDYRKLITPDKATVEFLPTEVISHQPFLNGGGAETNGAEVSAKWRPISRWEISAGITQLNGSSSAVQASPKHMETLLSHLDLVHHIEFNSALYAYAHVPFNPTATSAGQNVPSFNRVDLGMSWHFTQQWTLGVWGRNLQSDAHRETRDTDFTNVAGEVPRAVVFKLLWQSKPEAAGGK
jgi:iron complex outermembrane receptor protein